MELYKKMRISVREIKKYQISTYAASASFFLLTSLLPILMLVLSVSSWIGIEIDVELMKDFAKLLPETMQEILKYIIQNLRDAGVKEFSVSIIALLWSASKGMIGFVDGLNNIAGHEDKRNFIFKRLFCLLYMGVLIAGLLLTLGLRVFGHNILLFLQKYAPYIGNVFSIIMEFRGLALYLVITVTIAMVYAIFPNKKMNFIKQIPGAAIAAAAWLIFSAVYSLYVKYAAVSSGIYGGMGIIILAMLWVYFCVYIIFIGAAINRIFPNTMGKIWRLLKKVHR